MKKNIYYSFAVLFCVFTSCSKSNNPEEPGKGGGGYVSGTYWPYTVNNTWYLVNTEDPNDKSDLIIHKELTYNGKTYYQFKPVGAIEGFELTDGFREDNGVFISLYGATSRMGTNTSAGTVIEVNTNLKVGEVFKDEVTLTVSGLASGTIKHINESKILEKAPSATINGKKYLDVIKIEVKHTAINSITGNTVIITYERWLAKGIGLIYEKTKYGELDIKEYSLLSYSVK
ncbi:hypothetical protein ABDJ41_19265 [Pedobacter sp. ASV1-7]|uniref:hypothetical protein n=1 Tax=Pedobacter sp. ASV1-7 TaxID=3145237 RepID=UPI0032E937D2